MTNNKKKQNTKGIHDKRNKLNDLTGREWLKLTASFWLSKKCADDKDASKSASSLVSFDIIYSQIF